MPRSNIGIPCNTWMAWTAWHASPFTRGHFCKVRACCLCVWTLLLGRNATQCLKEEMILHGEVSPRLINCHMRSTGTGTHGHTHTRLAAASRPARDRLGRGTGHGPNAVPQKNKADELVNCLVADLCSRPSALRPGYSISSQLVPERKGTRKAESCTPTIDRNWCPLHGPWKRHALISLRALIPRGTRESRPTKPQA